MKGAYFGRDPKEKVWKGGGDMGFEGFYHPAISAPVLRRRVTELLLEMVATYGEILLTRGRAVEWMNAFPNRNSFSGAAQRLRREGFVAFTLPTRYPVLRILPEGDRRLRDLHHPDRFWEEKWDRRWYMLMYDIPEKQRKNRHALRQFLKRLRLGCLQKSVWATPRDIRPEFHDLQEAAGIDEYAVLLEGRTVLGLPPRRIVLKAWPFERLGLVQAGFCRDCEEAIRFVESGEPSKAELELIAREEMTAYVNAMWEDPLLPRVLHPLTYHGREVYQLHRRFVYAVAHAL